MLFPGAYKASDRHNRRLHNTQLAVAGQAGAVAQQKRHGACNLSGPWSANKRSSLQPAKCSRGKREFLATWSLFCNQ